MTSCRLCKRDPVKSSDLCKYHLSAKKNIQAAYRQWKEGYGDIAWNEYLKKVGRNAQTGQWAKEVAELLSKESAEQTGPET
jgi:hypothetical protein